MALGELAFAFFGGGGLSGALASTGVGGPAAAAVATASVAAAAHAAGVIGVVVKKEWHDHLIWNVATGNNPGEGGGDRPVNRDDVPYPKQEVEGYGEVPFPNGEIKVTDPAPLRAQFTKAYKDKFRKWWYDKYGWFPSPDVYDIHHIKPLSRGGTNDFDNLVPIKSGPDHNQFTTWWKKYP